MNIHYKSFYNIITVLFLAALFTSPAYSQDVPDSPADVNPILVNSTIPDVMVKTIDSEEVKLRSVVAEKPTMLIFYRGGWCPYCSRHMVELQQIESEILDIGYQIIAISVDKPEILKETLMKNELSYTLLSDSPADALKSFGVAYKVDDATVTRYKSVGIDFEKNTGYNHNILPAPAVFIIDQEGTVKFQYVNPDYKQRINGDVLLAAAKAYL
ncbi:MAG: peroxiredoxin-like family protein [Balneolaceae bacterium]